MGIVARVAAVGSVMLFACGSPPEVRAPDGTIGPVKPTTQEVGATEKHEHKRPEDVMAWIHIDDPDGLVDLFGIASSPVGAEANEWLENFDLRQPFDISVVFDEDKDPQFAVRLPVKDSGAVLKKLGVLFTLKEQGSRVLAYSQENPEENAKPEFECDLTAPTRGPDVMVCGMAKAIDVSGDWLRNAPVPKRENGPRQSGQPMVRATIYAKAVQKLFAPDSETGKRARDREKDLVDIIEDADTLSFELDKEGTKLALAGVFKMKTTKGDIAKQLVMTTGGGQPSDAFAKIWDATSAAVWTPGGGPLPTWAKLLETDVHKKSGGSGVSEKVAKLFEKSASVGFGVRTDKVKSGVAALKSAKDAKAKEKAKQQLGETLEGQFVFSLGQDTTSVQSTLKDAVTSWNADAKQWHDPSQKPFDKYTVRAPNAKYGLPKGSFVIDEKSIDWMAQSNAAATPGAPPVQKLKSEPMVFVPEGATTWGVTGGDEDAVAETAKKLLAAKPKSVESDPLFKRNGVLFAGFFGTTVGAFSMHRYEVQYGNPTPDVLADLEQDANAQRLPLAFVVTNEKKGDGGSIAFEIAGERKAVQVLGEHAAKSVFGGIGYLFMAMFAMNRHHYAPPVPPPPPPPTP